MRAAAGAEAHGHAHGGAAVAHDAFDVPRCSADAGGIARGSLPAHLAQITCERVERGLRGVLGDDGVELLGDEVHGLVPADALKFARAALADALHGPHDAGLFVLDALNVAHRAQAGVGITRASRHVAGLNAHELAVAHGALQVTTARAVDGAHGVHALLTRSLVGGHFALRCERALRCDARAEAHCGSDGDGADSLDERAARELAVAREVLGRGACGLHLLTHGFLPLPCGFALDAPVFRVIRAFDVGERSTAANGFPPSEVWRVDAWGRPHKWCGPTLFGLSSQKCEVSGCGWLQSERRTKGERGRRAQVDFKAGGSRWAHELCAPYGRDIRLLCIQQC